MRGDASPRHFLPRRAPTTADPLFALCATLRTLTTAAPRSSPCATHAGRLQPWLCSSPCVTAMHGTHRCGSFPFPFSRRAPTTAAPSAPAPPAGTTSPPFSTPSAVSRRFGALSRNITCAVPQPRDCFDPSAMKSWFGTPLESTLPPRQAPMQPRRTCHPPLPHSAACCPRADPACCPLPLLCCLTGKWTRAGSLAEGKSLRLYHSSATLLPSGKVSGEEAPSGGSPGQGMFGWVRSQRLARCRRCHCRCCRCCCRCCCCRCCCRCHCCRCCCSHTTLRSMHACPACLAAAPHACRLGVLTYPSTLRCSTLLAFVAAPTPC